MKVESIQRQRPDLSRARMWLKAKDRQSEETVLSGAATHRDMQGNEVKRIERNVKWLLTFRHADSSLCLQVFTTPLRHMSPFFYFPNFICTYNTCCACC